MTPLEHWGSQTIDTRRVSGDHKFSWYPLNGIPSIGHSFHITSDELLTWNQIYDAVALAAGRPAEKVYIPSDFLGTFDPDLKGSLIGYKAVSTIFDNSKIKRFVPEFQANIRFKDGIKETVSWFEDKSQRMVMNPHENELMDSIIRNYTRL